jgi:outer membrane protein
MKKILIIIFICFFSFNYSLADTPYFLDFKMILNESTAGKKAQTYLKNKLDKGFKDLNLKKDKILDEEKKIVQQKKVISNEEYKKKISELRSTVSSLQKERNTLIESVAKQRAKAKSELLKNLNPIVKNYMKEKKIRMVVDKKNVLLADENLDITKDIIELLNQKLKSIKLN